MSKSDQIKALRERRFAYDTARIANNGSIQQSVITTLAHAASDDDIVNKAAMPESVADTARKLSALINNNADHQAKWRLANLETNRQRAREGMRRKRQKDTDNAR